MRPFTMVALVGLLGLAALPFSRAGEAPQHHAERAPRAEGFVLARCSVCHSVDLIIQQRLDRAHWEATANKMVQWGADLSEAEVDLLVEFLAARFHPDAPPGVPLSDMDAAEPFQLDVPQTQGMPSGVPQDGATVFANHCQGCHGAGASGGFGPKLADNAILNVDDVFWEIVLHGRGSMPAWEHALNRQEIADIHAWLKTL
ncbi:MAG: cytochrome c [Nitrospirota bacterium]